MNKEDLADELIILIEQFSDYQKNSAYFSVAYLNRLDSTMDKLQNTLKDYKNRGC